MSSTLFDQPPEGHGERVLSARAPADLADAVDSLTRPGEDRSATIRRLLREGVAVERRARAAMRKGGTRHRRAGGTEAAAARAVRAGTARHRALSAFNRAGAVGMTADEVVALLPDPPNATPRRVTDLLQGGLIEPIEWHNDTMVRAGALGYRQLRELEERTALLDGRVGVARPTRTGSRATVYVITPVGRARLGDD